MDRITVVIVVVEQDSRTAERIDISATDNFLDSHKSVEPFIQLD